MLKKWIEIEKNGKHFDLEDNSFDVIEQKGQ